MGFKFLKYAIIFSVVIAPNMSSARIKKSSTRIEFGEAIQKSDEEIQISVKQVRESASRAPASLPSSEPEIQVAQKTKVKGLVPSMEELRVQQEKEMGGL